MIKFPFLHGCPTTGYIFYLPCGYKWPHTNILSNGIWAEVMDHGKFGAYLKIPYHSSQETESKLPPQRLSCNQQNVAEMTLHGPKARLGKAIEFLLASFWKFSLRGLSHHMSLLLPWGLHMERPCRQPTHTDRKRHQKTQLFESSQPGCQIYEWRNLPNDPVPATLWLQRRKTASGNTYLT